jgi:hypothetical protein
MNELDVTREILISALRVNEEQRKFPRIPVVARVSLLVADRHIEGELVNLSLNGALVISEEAVELNSSVTITILDTPASRGMAEMKAKVVRVQGNGLGLRFGQ